jgi:uncharacterized protein YutE (UPF0331/DUF86 family)
MVKKTEEERINVREAAKECGRNPETVRRWIWSGKLPAQKLGNQLFVKRGDLASYCKETAVAEYRAEANQDFLEPAIRFQNRLRARGYSEVDTAELVRKSREERMEQIRSSLRDTTRVVADRKAKLDFLKNATALRNEIHRRDGKVFDAEVMIRELRDDRERETMGDLQPPSIQPGSRADLIRRMRKLRAQIRARVGNLDVDETIEQLREERVNELTRLR